jgi:dTDP-4-dehydrorhamnose 3,5-epimerase
LDSIKDVRVSPLKILENDAGSILHILKESDDCFVSFGEAYFSTVKGGQVKGWKKHSRMILNIVVPNGKILFVLYDGREHSVTFRHKMEVTLSKENYQRLTVPPGVWMAFKGLTEDVNLLLNIASIPHDPAEADNLPLDNDFINYSFK